VAVFRAAGERIGVEWRITMICVSRVRRWAAGTPASLFGGHLLPLIWRSLPPAGSDHRKEVGRTPPTHAQSLWLPVSVGAQGSYMVLNVATLWFSAVVYIQIRNVRSDSIRDSLGCYQSFALKLVWDHDAIRLRMFIVCLKADRSTASITNKKK